MSTVQLSANDLNFSGGPGALPHEVLLQAQQAMIALPETGLSVLGMSHRSAWFRELLDEAEQHIRELLNLEDRYAVLFLQGGSSLQFSMIPANFAHGAKRPTEFVASGYWSGKAIGEAACAAPVKVLWDGGADGYHRLPDFEELAWNPQAPFFHYVSNETVEGLQFHQTPRMEGATVISDMSSDFLSRPIDAGRYAMIYAHAQKNLGPAGVTVAILDTALLDRIPDGLPPMLDYRTHVRHRSIYNTPPVFSLYVLTLICRWLRQDIGGLEAMEAINSLKAGRLYQCLDDMGGLVIPQAERDFRSQMNVSFRFRDPKLDALCLQEAADAGFSGLGGHRSIGGLRASIYNAVLPAAVELLAEFLEDFAQRHG